MVTTQYSTLQQSVTQDSDYISMPTLSLRTATNDTTVTQDSHNNQV